MNTTEATKKMKAAWAYAAEIIDHLKLSMLLGEQPEAIIGLLAVLNDVSVEEIKDQPASTTLQQLKDPMVGELFHTISMALRLVNIEACDISALKEAPPA